MEISIKCETAHQLPIDQLTEFQGDLKNLTEESYQKFKKQLLELGFSAPFFVWKDNQKNYILDGHQRLRTLTQMQKEGCFVPPLPVVYVQAKDRQEAKKKVLAFTSQYGEMSQESLSDFSIDAEIDFEFLKDHFKFPEVDLKTMAFEHELEEKEQNESVGLFSAVVEFSSHEEMTEIAEELSGRGLIVKIK
jgi:hypothetical protein